MERKDYRQLKEAFVQVQINEANKAQEQQLWNEVQAYSNDLISEGYDLSEMTWDDVRESYLTEGRSAAKREQDQKRAQRRADAAAG